MFKVGDRVQVIADYSCYFEWRGTIVEEQAIGLAVEFSTLDGKLFFQPEELKKIYD